MSTALLHEYPCVTPSEVAVLFAIHALARPRVAVLNHQLTTHPFKVAARDGGRGGHSSVPSAASPSPFAELASPSSSLASLAAVATYANAYSAADPLAHPLCFQAASPLMRGAIGQWLLAHATRHPSSSSSLPLSETLRLGSSGGDAGDGDASSYSPSSESFAVLNSFIDLLVGFALGGDGTTSCIPHRCSRRPVLYSGVGSGGGSGGGGIRNTSTIPVQRGRVGFAHHASSSSSMTGSGSKAVTAATTASTTQQRQSDALIARQILRDLEEIIVSASTSITSLYQRLYSTREMAYTMVPSVEVFEKATTMMFEKRDDDEDDDNAKSAAEEEQGHALDKAQQSQQSVSPPSSAAAAVASSSSSPPPPLFVAPAPLSPEFQTLLRQAALPIDCSLSRYCRWLRVKWEASPHDERIRLFNLIKNGWDARYAECLANAKKRFLSAKKMAAATSSSSSPATNTSSRNRSSSSRARVSGSGRHSSTASVTMAATTDGTRKSEGGSSNAGRLSFEAVVTEGGDRNGNRNSNGNGDRKRPRSRRTSFANAANSAADRNTTCADGDAEGKTAAVGRTSSTSRNSTTIKQPRNDNGHHDNDETGQDGNSSTLMANAEAFFDPNAFARRLFDEEPLREDQQHAAAVLLQSYMTLHGPMHVPELSEPFAAVASNQMTRLASHLLECGYTQRSAVVNAIIVNATHHSATGGALIVAIAHLHRHASLVACGQWVSAAEEIATALHAARRYESLMLSTALLSANGGGGGSGGGREAADDPNSPSSSSGGGGGGSLATASAISQLRLCQQTRITAILALCELLIACPAALLHRLRVLTVSLLQEATVVCGGGMSAGGGSSSSSADGRGGGGHSSSSSSLAGAAISSASVSGGGLDALGGFLSSSAYGGIAANLRAHADVAAAVTALQGSGGVSGGTAASAAAAVSGGGGGGGQGSRGGVGSVGGVLPGSGGGGALLGLNPASVADGATFFATIQSAITSLLRLVRTIAASSPMVMEKKSGFRAAVLAQSQALLVRCRGLYPNALGGGGGGGEGGNSYRRPKALTIGGAGQKQQQQQPSVSSLSYSILSSSSSPLAFSSFLPLLSFFSSAAASSSSSLSAPRSLQRAQAVLLRNQCASLMIAEGMAAVGFGSGAASSSSRPFALLKTIRNARAFLQSLQQSNNMSSSALADAAQSPKNSSNQQCPPLHLHLLPPTLGWSLHAVVLFCAAALCEQRGLGSAALSLALGGLAMVGGLGKVFIQPPSVSSSAPFAALNKTSFSSAPFPSSSIEDQCRQWIESFAGRPSPSSSTTTCGGNTNSTAFTPANTATSRTPTASAQSLAEDLRLLGEYFKNNSNGNTLNHNNNNTSATSNNSQRKTIAASSSRRQKKNDDDGTTHHLLTTAMNTIGPKLSSVNVNTAWLSLAMAGSKQSEVALAARGGQEVVSGGGNGGEGGGGGGGEAAFPPFHVGGSRSRSDGSGSDLAAPMMTTADDSDPSSVPLRNPLPPTFLDLGLGDRNDNAAAANAKATNTSGNTIDEEKAPKIILIDSDNTAVTTAANAGSITDTTSTVHPSEALRHALATSNVLLTPESVSLMVSGLGIVARSGGGAGATAMLGSGGGSGGANTSDGRLLLSAGASTLLHHIGLAFHCPSALFSAVTHKLLTFASSSSSLSSTVGVGAGDASPLSSSSASQRFIYFAPAHYASSECLSLIRSADELLRIANMCGMRSSSSSSSSSPVEELTLALLPLLWRNAIAANVFVAGGAGGAGGGGFNGPLLASTTLCPPPSFCSTTAAAASSPPSPFALINSIVEQKILFAFGKSGSEKKSRTTFSSPSSTLSPSMLRLKLLLSQWRRQELRETIAAMAAAAAANNSTLDKAAREVGEWSLSGLEQRMFGDAISSSSLSSSLSMSGVDTHHTALPLSLQLPLLAEAALTATEEKKEAKRRNGSSAHAYQQRAQHQTKSILRKLQQLARISKLRACQEANCVDASSSSLSINYSDRSLLHVCDDVETLFERLLKEEAFSEGGAN